MIQRLFKYHIAFSFLLLVGLSFCALSVFSPKASADSCTPNGRDCYYGYFYNGYDGGAAANGTRWNVISAPALLNVNNAGDLVGWIGGYLNGCSDLNSQNQTGAAFIILTMLSAPAGTNKADACGRFGEWSQLVTDMIPYTNYNIIYDFNCINTRSTLTDVAWYPSCGAAASIVFYSPQSGLPVYAIKKDCANPLGSIQPITRDFNLKSTITTQVNGVNASQAEAGDSITFRYYVNNIGTTNSSTANCNGGAFNRSGYFPTPGTPEGGGSPLFLNCTSRIFAPGNNFVGGPETFTAVANTTYCRTLFVSPATQTGGSHGTEVCLPVVSKPYLKVYGGDVSAGGDVANPVGSSTCSSNPNAAIVAWNKLAAGSYAGAGTQYAAFALNAINGFATAQESTGAPAPTGLSFANTSTNASTGNFGGNFGSVPCIKNYFGAKPTSGVESLSLLHRGTGVFEAGSTTFSGATLRPKDVVNATDKWTFYIDGDLYITGNIIYNGSWSLADMPFLQVVVRGNIYVAAGVTRLDGSYIAQQDTSGNRGNIYTCTTSAAPPSLVNGAFYSVCTNKLTVNGSFTARDIQFLRTRGTLRQSATGEASGASDAAEEFNYSPAFWITQPTSDSSNNGHMDNYDAITSLPPVL